MSCSAAPPRASAATTSPNGAIPSTTLSSRGRSWSPTRRSATELYRKAQAIFKAEAPWVPIAHSVVFMAPRREVKGFQMDPLGRHIFDRVDLQP